MLIQGFERKEVPAYRVSLTHLLTLVLIIGRPKELPKIRHRLDINDHRHKTRGVLELLQHGGVQVKFDLDTVILRL